MDMSVNPMSGIFGGGGAGGAGGVGGLMGMLSGGGMGGIGQLINKVLSQVVQGVIGDVAKSLGLPDSTKDMAQAMAAASFGDKAGVKQNVKELIADFQKESGASDTDMGHVDRKMEELKETLKKAFNDFIREEGDRNANGSGKKKGGSAPAGGGAAGGAGGAEGGGGADAAKGAEDSCTPGGTEETSGDDEGAVDWFTKIAFALARGAQNQANKVAKASDELTNANKKADAVPEGNKSEAKKAESEQMLKQVKLQAESSKMGFLMQAVNASINSLGEALKTAAQVK
jgi:hypothetical protein